VSSLNGAVRAVPVRPGEHACCRFADAGDRERLAIAFVRDGLERGEKVMYYADRDDVARMLTRLEEMDPHLEPALTGGQLEVRPASETYMPAGRFDSDQMLGVVRDEYERALEEGYTGLSMTGEIPVALCEAPGREQLALYEARLERDHESVPADAPPYSILCQYDHGRFAPAILSDVAEAHQVDVSPELAPIGRNGHLAAARDRAHDALRLSGELDYGCAQTVSEVLDAHFHGPLRLDLADLSYVDVAGMRALRGRKGQPVTIASASEAVRRLLELLAWDTDPGIELAEAG
jgi:ABC-type transporter Mla MlaB component